jgi:hypothetical protein
VRFNCVQEVSGSDATDLRGLWKPSHYSATPCRIAAQRFYLLGLALMSLSTDRELAVAQLQASLEKVSETSITLPEFAKAQAKLKCAQHPGTNRWCYAMGPSSKYPGKHVGFGIDIVNRWARKMVRDRPILLPNLFIYLSLQQDGEVDDDCVSHPPSSSSTSLLSMSLGGAHTWPWAILPTSYSCPCRWFWVQRSYPS